MCFAIKYKPIATLSHCGTYLVLSMAGFDIDKKDGAYSWIVLITIIVSNLCAMGFIFGALGVCSSIYPSVFNKPHVETSIIATVVVFVNQFTGESFKILFC